MEPPNKRTQQQGQPSSSSSVPPPEDVPSIKEQLKGHGFLEQEIAMLLTQPTAPAEPYLKRRVQEDDTDAYFLGLLPQEAYASSPKRAKFLDFLNDPETNEPITMVISDDDDNDNAGNINNETETHQNDDRNVSDDDDDDQTQRTAEILNNIRRDAEILKNRRRERQEREKREIMERNKVVAKKYASDIHGVLVENEEEKGAVAHEIDDGSQTPFSEAMKAIQKQVEKSKTKGYVDESLIWISKRNGKDLVNGRFWIPSLQELSLKVLAKHADALASLEGVSDELKLMLSNLLCDSRRMNCHFLEMLLSGCPNVIRLKDCSWLTAKEFTKYFGTLDTSIIEVLQLNQCGRIITESTLPATLAKSPSCLSKLISLSLTGSGCLNDEMLQLLVSSATALRSINLSQCSTLTFSGVEILADSLGSILKELYLDDCILIDAALVLPALKRFEQLDVLSLAGLPNVNDKFIIDYIVACGHNIKELVLKDCANLTDASISIIAKHCPGLHALDLGCLCKLTDLSIVHITNSCRALRTLKLCRNPFSDEAIGAFLAVTGKSLEELSLNNIKKVGKQTAISLARNAKNLHTLDLSWCRNLTDNEFGLIVDNCESLRLLKIFGCTQVTDFFLRGHSNSEIQIIGLKLSPLLQHIKGPDPHQGALRY